MRVNDFFKHRLKVALRKTVGGRPVSVKHMLEVAENRPYSHRMTQSLDAAEQTLIAAIREISGDADRYQAARDLEGRLSTSLKEIKAEAARNLHEGRSWSQVGELLGVTGSRAEQISRGAR